MRAATFADHGGPEVVRVDDVPTPEAGGGEVRVRVRASSLNHLDLWTRRGLPFDVPMPHVGGSDIAGEVDSVGPGVEGWSRGERVVVDPSLDYGWYEGSAPPLRVIGEHTQGGHAEFAVVPAVNLVRLPDAVDWTTAAAAGLTYVTAWHGLVGRAELRAGETLLVTGGSGGVATAAIQIGKLTGAEVFAVTSRPNLDRVAALGADHVYDRTQEGWSRRLWADTGRRGVDVALDSVGEALWPTLIRSLAPMGRLVTYGATTGYRAESDLRLVFWKQLSILGSTMGSPAEFRAVMEKVFAGDLVPVIHEVLGLEDVRRGHEMLEAGQVFGKLVVVP